MEHRSRLTIVIATLAVSLMVTGVCWAQPPSPPAAALLSPPGPATANQVSRQKSTPTEAIDLCHPTDFAAFFRMPGESAGAKPTPVRTSVPNYSRTPTGLAALDPPSRQFGQPAHRSRQFRMADRTRTRRRRCASYR